MLALSHRLSQKKRSAEQKTRHCVTAEDPVDTIEDSISNIREEYELNSPEFP